MHVLLFLFSNFYQLFS